MNVKLFKGKSQMHDCLMIPIDWKTCVSTMYQMTSYLMYLRLNV